ncbi:MAG: uracil-DNA glycosylase family protein [Syntrophothermus sp.]
MPEMSFAEKVIRFNKSLELSGLPEGIAALNPYAGEPEITRAMESFYRKYYSDTKIRKSILGINPGRHGAGATGIPFTDTKRLKEVCGIKINSFSTHEPSSVFVYELIERFGGAEKFYSRYYINSICPLGFVKLNEKNKFVNYNYYDSQELFGIIKPFIISSIKKQISFGIDQEICFILGKKNLKYFEKINDEFHFFKNLIMLEHPRYIVQYKQKSKEEYIAKYLKVLR